MGSNEWAPALLAVSLRLPAREGCRSRTPPPLLTAPPDTPIDQRLTYTDKRITGVANRLQQFAVVCS
eukprot:437280-Alexandrium_andersonii.AAC.1